MHPFLWKNGTMNDLGTLGGDNGFPFWVNQRGDVVGMADLPGGQASHAFIWRNGVMTDLGTLGSDSVAISINATDEVVGTSFVSGSPPNGRAFVWRPGGSMVDLNTLISAAADLILVSALTINDSGEIAGVGFPKGAPPNSVEHTGHAFLLIPCTQHNHPCIARRSSAVSSGAKEWAAQSPSQAESANGVLQSLRAKLAKRLHIPLFKKLSANEQI
jgi:probable HAF family extracellular repeat protein